MLQILESLGCDMEAAKTEILAGLAEEAADFEALQKELENHPPSLWFHVIKEEAKKAFNDNHRSDIIRLLQDML